MKFLSPRLAFYFVVAAIGAGCSVSMGDTSSAESAGPQSWADAGAGAMMGDGAASATAKSRSMRCGRDVPQQCLPDLTDACNENGLGSDGSADGGYPPSPTDAGAAVPDAWAGPFVDASTALQDSGKRACRMGRSGESLAAVCEVAGSGEDGAACRASSDCAAGFDCVGSPGQCRRYCCTTACGNDRFCDDQAVAGEESVVVPVCVPFHPCKLLSSKGCPDNETCAIADPNDGRTSCVHIGTKAAGESCEDGNCAAGLTCLGQEGDRKCFKLCEKSTYGSCPTDYKCRGSAPLFQDPDQGVCLKEVPNR